MEDYAEITVRQASNRLHEYHLIDVREPDEFTGELGHIAGSSLLPLGELMARIDQGHGVEALFGETGGRPLLMICRSGNRSGKACARLAEVGIAAATNMVGGLLEWNRAGLPVTRAAADRASA